jgi:predicted O-linked N-acetylglucosamine transferase (SPINDLY family)
MNRKHRRHQITFQPRHVAAPIAASTAEADSGAAEAALAAAIKHHQAGELKEAAALYRKILEARPGHAEALHLLGVIALQTGRPKIAASLIAKAVARQPDFAEAHSNLGVALVNLGKLDEAVAAFRQAVSLKPDYAEAHANLGAALKNLGQIDEAVASYRKAIALKPDNAEAHNDLGAALKDQGKLDEAVASYRKAIALRPDHAEAHGSLGVALANQGRLDEAVASFRQAVSLRPDHAEAHGNLGNALKDQGKLDEAIASYRKAIACNPNLAEAHYNFGLALKRQGRLDEAVASYRTAIALKPDSAKAHNNLGIALKAQGKPDEAAAAHQRAIALKPDFAKAHNNLGNALRDQGELDKAVAFFRKAIALDPDFAWAHNNLGGALARQGKQEEAVTSRRTAIALKPELADAHSNLLLALNYANGISEEVLFAEHLEFDERHARPLAAHIQPHRNNLDPARRLKIGYVSPDFRGHSVAFFIEPVLERHDHEACEIFCYYNHGRGDEVTERLRRYADHWLGCAGMTDEVLADRIREDRIDILVDLAGHTAKNRLLVFARKPAPVQATWIGYPNTTGLAAMDYRITDANLDPMGKTEQYYAEELARLPIHACFRPPADSPDVGALPAVKAGYVTFASFNNFAKITPEVMALWARILKGVRNSRLIMMNVAQGEAESHVRQTFANNGIADGRLNLMQRIPFVEFLEFHNSVDIGLDTFPYNGGTTTRLGLWMGVPYITLAGATARSRTGTQLLSHVGHPELIATTPKEYVRRAVDLATDVGRLRELRAGLRGRMARSPFTDGERITRSLETAYRGMWARYCNREHEQTDSIELGEENGADRRF